MRSHPATHPTPEQLATVKALRARLKKVIAITPEWRAVRAVRMARNLDAYAKHDRLGLHLFLADWQEGIEAECASLEMAGRAQVRRKAA